MTPAEFARKWRRNLRTESAASHEHIMNLCQMLGEATPNDDPTGDSYAFEKGAAKSGGGDGWADVWKKDCFAWEYKGRHKNLRAALAQLNEYRVALDNPPLLVVSDLSVIEIHTNFEEGLSPVALLIGAVAACAMFAFAVAGGAWLGIVAPEPSTAAHRRLVVAAVAGAAAVPASLAFRDAILSATGMVGNHGPGSLAALVAVAGAATFLSVLLLSTFGTRQT